ncbi:MAG: hypothetical protein WBA67_01565 [Jannaschia sp.]
MFQHHRSPIPLRSPLARARDWLTGRIDDMSGQVRCASRLEALCMSLGIGGMALALGVTVAQATLAPFAVTEEALRRAVVSADFDDALCPDGWASDHAAILRMTEAEVTAWYLRESFELSDQAVISAVGFYLMNASDFRQIEGPALTRNQIHLCIAESRRLTQPLRDLLPPHLRDVSLNDV